MEQFKSVAVIGAGLMGHALALVHAIGGCQIKMQDVNAEQLEVGMGLVESALDTMIMAGAIDDKNRMHILKRIEAVETIDAAVSDSDLIVEAVVENIDVKTFVFREIDKFAPSTAIIASNTSNLDIFPLVPENRLKNCIIAHWYTPPYIIDLVDLAAVSYTHLTLPPTPYG